MEEQCKYASQNVFKQQKDLQKIKKDYEEDLNRYTEISNQLEKLNIQKQQYQFSLEKVIKELGEQEEKLKRAEKLLQTKLNSIKTKKINIGGDNAHIIQMNYDIEYNKNKTLINAIMYINTFKKKKK